MGLLDYLQEKGQGILAGGAKPRAIVAGLLGGDTSALKGAWNELKQLGDPNYMRKIKGISNQEAMNIALDANPVMALTFVGKGSKTWDAVAAKKAMEMADKGIDERKIWEATGTFKGADGHWRQEIDDSLAKFNDGMPSWNRLDESLPIKESLNHEGIYGAYPDTGEIKLVKTDAGNAGFYSKSDNEIGMVGVLPRKAASSNKQFKQWNESAKSTALHELQHAIQEKEGWAKGGSPQGMKEEALAMLRRDVASGAIPSTEQAMEMLPMAQQNAYKRLAGEAEARATQARMNMTPEQRRAVFPFDSYDVPRESLIIRGLLGSN